MKKSLFIFLLLLSLSLVSCGQQPSTSSTSQVTSVENESITITLDCWDEVSGDLTTVTREGTYTGEMINNIPNGQGVFSTINDAGSEWTYTGEFSDGKFNGTGKIVWSETGQIEEGTYTDGVFTPNTYELFNNLAPRCFIPYSFSKENEVFVKNNLMLFPANTEEAAQSAADLINSDLTYPMMTKTLEGFEGQLYHCNYGQVLQILQSSWYGHTVTNIIVEDDDYNFYVILYDGALPDVYDNTAISFTGLPISYSSYENAGGGHTLAIVLLGSTVQVVE